MSASSALWLAALALSGGEPPHGDRVAVRGVYGGWPDALLEEGRSPADWGVNAVWVGSGGLDAKQVQKWKALGVRVFAEFNTMHASEYLKDHPDAAPIGTDGRPAPAPNGWQGVRPTHPGYRAWRMAEFRKALTDFEVDGIWLDYHHAHSSWEQETPELPDTDFHPETLAQFERETGVDLPDRPVPELAAILLGERLEAWTAWRCSVYTDWAREFDAIRDEVRPRALLGTFHCPWSTEERDGALRHKLAIDLRSQSRYVDVFSPMPYHARLGHADRPEWIAERTAWLGEHLGIKGLPDERLKIWPIVQLSDWGERVPTEQVRRALANGSKAPATGVMAFAWGGLVKEKAKIEEMGSYYRSLVGQGEGHGRTRKGHGR